MSLRLKKQQAQMAVNRILLVDDDKAFIYLAKKRFKDYGVTCPIDEAYDGAEALEYLQNCAQCPDIILLDINMPVLDAYEFLKEYAETAKCKDHSCIFILTSSNNPLDQKNLLANPLVSGYFTKPLTDAQIKQVLLTP